MLDDDRIALRERYRKRWQEFGVDPRTLGWNKDCQWVRFEAFLEGVRPEELGSILDVGCGFGDLLGFLRGRGWNGRYMGVDLVEEFTDAARTRYADDADASFICGDFESLSVKSDAVVAIGIFNHKVQQGNSLFIRQAVDAMWKACNSLVVCDFLSSNSDAEHRREHLHYANPSEMYQLASQYSRRVMIHHSYMPFEFQMKIWRDDSFDAAAPVFGAVSEASDEKQSRDVALH